MSACRRVARHGDKLTLLNAPPAVNPYDATTTAPDGEDSAIGRERRAAQAHLISQLRQSYMHLCQTRGEVSNVTQHRAHTSHSQTTRNVVVRCGVLLFRPAVSGTRAERRATWRMTFCRSALPTLAPGLR